MTLDDILPKLSGVRQTTRGILALCPSHDDRHPSLSVKEGDRGLLLKCWAGCTAADIVAAMGLRLADLFYDLGQPRLHRPRSSSRIDLNRVSFQLRLHGDLLFLRAQGVLQAARHLDVAGWTDEDFDRAMNAVAKAYADRERSHLLDDVAFSLRCKILAKEVRRDAA